MSEYVKYLVTLRTTLISPRDDAFIDLYFLTKIK